jgi:hypothetical protein
VRSERLEWREVGMQVRDDELEDLLGPAEVFEAVAAQVAQRHIGRQLLAYQLHHR